MTTEIKSYLQNLENLSKEKKITQKALDNVLYHIHFFQHERLIHLIVTITMAILTVGVFIVLMINKTLIFPLLFLFILLLSLLIPYLVHYYLLENSVQKMYQWYDILLEKVLHLK